MAGSVQHLRGDTYRYRWSEVDRDGVRRQRSRSFKATGKKDADRKAAAMERQLEVEATAAAVYADTFAELVDDWLAVKARHCSATTMRGYRRHTDLMVARWGRRRTADITGRDIDHWFAHLAETGVNAGTQHHLWGTLRAVLNFGNKKRDLPTVATDKATAPKYRRPEVDPPDAPTVRAAMALCDGTDWGRAIQLAALTGARRGEIIAAKAADMRWTEVDDLMFCTWRLERAAIEVKGGTEVKTTKGGRVRHIELSGGAAVVLAAQLAWVNGRSEWLFPQPGHWKATRSPSWLSHAWEEVRRQVPGCEQVRLHDLRHWFATSALNQGIPLTTVSAILGHAQTSTTANIYGHSDRTTQRLAVEKVAGALNPAPLTPRSTVAS